jgi:hypothetical protein
LSTCWTTRNESFENKKSVNYKEKEKKATTKIKLIIKYQKTEEGEEEKETKHTQLASKTRSRNEKQKIKDGQ